MFVVRILFKALGAIPIPSNISEKSATSFAHQLRFRDVDFGA